jgi:hypothetical protein
MSFISMSLRIGGEGRFTGFQGPLFPNFLFDNLLGNWVGGLQFWRYFIHYCDVRIWITILEKLGSFSLDCQ